MTAVPEDVADSVRTHSARVGQPAAAAEAETPPGVSARLRAVLSRGLAAPVGTAALAVAAATVIYLGNPTDSHNHLPVCPSKLLFGIDCPGCGSLRMIYSLLHGDLPAALHYNAVAVVALPLLGWSWLTWTRARARGQVRPRSWQHWRWSPTIVLVVVLTWGVLRNLPFHPFVDLYV